MTHAGPYRVVSFEGLSSTNDEAMVRLRKGEPGNFFVTARSQTAGRGRQARAWSSPPGNLYATLALLEPSSVPVAPQLGFVAGVALAKALRIRLAGDDRLKIKWPNDMVFGNAKLAGILLECCKLHNGQTACVVGFGVNCLTHPAGLAYPTTNLFAAGDPAPAPASVLSVLAEVMASELRIWDRGLGFAAIRGSWLALAAGKSETITVATSSRVLTGVFRGLDLTGRLLLETGGSLVTIESGDVFLPGSSAQATG